MNYQALNLDSFRTQIRNRRRSNNTPQCVLEGKNQIKNLPNLYLYNFVNILLYTSAVL